MKKPRLRWSLRTFLIVVLLLGAAFGTVGRRVYHQRRIISTIQAMTAASGGRCSVEYDYEFDDMQHVPANASYVPGVLLNFLGPNVFHDVVGVNLDGGRCTLSDLKELQSLPKLRQLDVEYSTVTPEFLATLATLTNLERLDLQETGIRDDDLAAVASLEKLRTLILSGPYITDAGLKHLTGLQNLRTLTIRRCSVTKDALQALEAALPECKIQISKHNDEPL